MATQICVLNPTTTLIDTVDGVSSFSSPNPINAGKPVLLNQEGMLDVSFVSTQQIAAIASQSLNQGDLVNVYYGTINGVSAVYAREASASSSTPYAASGYVSQSVSAGANVSVYVGGINSVSFISGFSPNDIGQPVYLSSTVPGYITKTAPSPPNLNQSVGIIYQVTGLLNGVVQVSTILTPPVTANVSVAQLASSFVSETPAGALPGTVFTLSNTPSLFMLFMVNGGSLIPNADYTISNTTITLNKPVYAGDNLHAIYFV